MTDSTDNTDSSVSSVSPAPPRTTVPTIDLPTTTEDRMSTQPTTSTTVEAAAPTSAERLSGDEPYVLAFGGQATPWRATLDELVGLDQELAGALVRTNQANFSAALRDDVSELRRYAKTLCMPLPTVQCSIR